MAFFTRVVGRHGHGHGHGHHRAASSDGGAIGDSGDDQAAAGLSINTSDHDPLLLERGTPPHGAAAGSAPCQPPHPPQPHGSPRAAGGGGGGSHQQQRQRAGAGTPSAGGGRPGSGGGSGGRRRAPLPANPLWVAWRALKAGLCQFALLPSAADALGGGSPGTATTLVAVVLSSPQAVALLLLAAYALLLLLWLPLYALARLVSEPGVYATIALALYATGRYVARSLTFPGAGPMILRALESEYAAQTGRRLEHCALRVKEWASDLRVVLLISAPGGQRVPHPRLAQHHMEVLYLCRHTLAGLGKALSAVIDGDGATDDADALLSPVPGRGRLRGELRLSESAARDAYALKNALDKLTWAIDALCPHVGRRLFHPAAAAGVNGSNGSGSGGGGGDAAGVSSSSSPSLAFDQDPLPAVGVAAEAAEEVRRLLPALLKPREEQQRALANDTGLWAGAKQLWRARWTGWDSVLGSGLMREELCARLGARQLWATMPDGARLDCCLVPTQRVHPATGRPLGLIIYCQPNAGLYEASALLGPSLPSPHAATGGAALTGDWVEFYTSLGNDVLVFNYRGYGRSEGTPSPAALRRDAECLVRMVREELGAKRVGLHGESVGGLVAAHAAARCDGVALLVADRTFASLPAVADRLLFQGAGAALRFFTGWSTASMDVVSDYLACPAYKLACNDSANDSVIHEACSLKAGVAVRKELLGEDGRGDGVRAAAALSSAASSTWGLPREYLLTDAHGRAPSTLLPLAPYPTAPPSNDNDNNDAATEAAAAAAATAAFAPLLPPTPRAPLTERGAAHFAACCLYLAKRSREQDRRDVDATSQQQPADSRWHSNPHPSSPSAAASDLELQKRRRPTGSPTGRHEAARRRLWSLQQRQQGGWGSSLDGDVEEGSSSGSDGGRGGGWLLPDVSAASSSPSASYGGEGGSFGSSSEEEDEEELMRAGSYQDPSYHHNAFHRRGAGSRTPSPTPPGLQQWGRQEGALLPSSPGCPSVPGCSAVQQAWRTLARCDGLCGLMLGQAVAMGGGGGPPDAAAVRAWLCSLAVWGPGQEALSLLGAAGSGGPGMAGSPRGASILPRLSVKQCRAALEALWERRREELSAEGVKGEVDFCRRMLAYLDERLSHDVEEALRREEEALLAAAAALDGGDAPSKQYQQQHQQPRRSASSDSEPDAHGGGGGGDNIDDDDDDRAALLPRPGTPSALPGSIVHAHASGGRGSVGQLLPLACGHNAPFSEGERARLVFHVASQGWSLDAFGAS